MNPLSIFWTRLKERKHGSGWIIVAWLALWVAASVSIWFFAYRVATQMSMHTWARYAGQLQATVWFQEGRYRWLELSTEEKTKFTGKTNGPFEIWTWSHYTNTPLLTVQTADQVFVDAYNARMKQLWEVKYKQPIQSVTNDF